ncbi:MAG: prolipoprotein diacylglyceryl transferase [Candidatus Saganbacteria bacterium]|nr:prolipoprotein diacylglyceryl transferase [Candidatus Saganbacteria bacterium]
MHPILFQYGFISIHSYGVMAALGFLVGICLVLWLAYKANVDINKILDLAIVVMVSAIIGARLFYVIGFWPAYAARPWEIFMVWQGGLVFYGGLIVAALSTMIFLRVNKMPFWKVLDFITFATVIGMIFGRIGCFLNGCCYGIETKVPWAVQFPELLGKRHPTQIYESIDLLIILGILFIIYRLVKKDGIVFAFGLMLYAIHRFLVEFLRENPYYFFGLSAAQWISILLFVVGWMVLFRKKTNPTLKCGE